MNGMSLLLKLRTCILQFLEVVVEGQGEIELIHLRILRSDDVVILEQVHNRLVELNNTGDFERTGSTSQQDSTRHDVRLEF